MKNNLQVNTLVDFDHKEKKVWPIKNYERVSKLDHLLQTLSFLKRFIWFHQNSYLGEFSLLCLYKTVMKVISLKMKLQE